MLNSGPTEEEHPLNRENGLGHNMELASAGEPQGFLLVSRRNNSLSPASRHLVLGSSVLLSLAISLPFALLGAWLILPFAGAEMIVLYLAFRIIARHARDFESVSINGDRPVIERWETDRGDRYEFSRYWAQVVLRPPLSGRSDTVAVRSHGREVELGRHLTDEQRRAWARTLKGYLSNR